ncbi:MAG: hypothetical protein ACYCYM_03770 [Saccharofermentanales bacterium]
MRIKLLLLIAIVMLVSSCSNPGAGSPDPESRSVSSAITNHPSTAESDGTSGMSASASISSILPDSSASGSLSQSSIASAAASSSGSGFDWGTIGGTKLLLLSPSQGSMASSLKPVFRWSGIDADSYTFYLERKDGGVFKQIEKKIGLKEPQYQIPVSLVEGNVYRWRAQAQKDGETVDHDNGGTGGAVFMTSIPYKKHPANSGMNFTFDGSVSEQVLRNYLSRSITMSFLSVPSESLDSDVRMILNTGAKYIGRATIPWEAETDYTQTIEKYRRQIDAIHQSDPEIIFEACIFETVFKSCGQVAIPDWVFQAFGQKAEKRNFSYDRMLFESGKYVDQWGKGSSIPDITRIETQMYFYYRGCRYIDAGFEAIHWGQVMLIGENDTGFVKYGEVLAMIRQYAKTHSRRHFILNNGATHGIAGPDGVLLFDFHVYPARMRPEEGAAPHGPSQAAPQKTILEIGYLDSIYKKSMGGKTRSGWTCNTLPYVVDIDNYGGYENGYLNKPDRPYWPWGMDEISWFANQPSDYRATWLGYAYGWVRDNDPAGYLMMPGSRVVYKQDTGAMTWYYANSKEMTGSAWGDEETIRSIWVIDNQ